jgi:hypothetical protein
MLNLWQSVHHVISRELAQHQKVQVPEPRVSKPAALCPLHHQIDRSTKFNIQNVQTICRSQDLGEQAALNIFDLHDSSLDYCLEPNLVKLTNIDDVGGQLWDEVNTGERTVLIVLTAEQHNYHPFNPHN